MGAGMYEARKNKAQGPGLSVKAFSEAIVAAAAYAERRKRYAFRKKLLQPVIIPDSIYVENPALTVPGRAKDAYELESINTLYEIDDNGLGILDEHFMVGFMEYRRKSTQVMVEDGDVATAAIYVGNKRLSGLRPSRQHLDQLIAGATSRGLSAEYIAFLEKIESLE